MKEAKQKRLRAAGWSVSGTNEFLGLSDTAAAVIEVKLQLASVRRTERTRRRRTQNQLNRVIAKRSGARNKPPPAR